MKEFDEGYQQACKEFEKGVGFMASQKVKAPHFVDKAIQTSILELEEPFFCRAARAPRTKKRKNRVTPKRNRLKFICVIVKDLKPYCCLFRHPFLSNHIVSDH